MKIYSSIYVKETAATYLCFHKYLLTVCRSCIMKHISKSNLCPVCGLLIHKTRPETCLIADKNLQQIVYKLVPGLLKDEIERRNKFCSQNENAFKGADNFLSVSDYTDSLETDNSKFCILVNIIKSEQTYSRKILLRNKSKKYLLCPGLFSVRLLKKFVQDKCELDKIDNVEVIYSSDDEFLPDHYTLLDVANIYNWRADLPLELKCIIWRDSDFIAEESTRVISNPKEESLNASSEYPFHSFKEFCKHVRKTKLCPFISPKKRHKKIRNKVALRDITNVRETSGELSIDDKSLSVITDKDKSRVELVEDSVIQNVSSSHEGCKLKLRIKTKGIEDSVLILPSVCDNTSGQEICVDQTSGHKSIELMEDKSFLSVSQILKGSNDKSIKKVMSKKDMFFSRLCLDDFSNSYDISKSEINQNKNDQHVPLLSNESSRTDYCKNQEPLQITIEESNVSHCVSNAISYNFKKRLLLTTVPTRAKGQLWTPYKSPLKEICQSNKNQISPVGPKRSKSPIIVFNPALPLPSFNSLLQSFGSKGVQDSVQMADQISSDANQVSLNSKIGIFISKGRSMTLEQKTKLVCDGVAPDETTNVEVNECTIDKPGDVLQVEDTSDSMEQIEQNINEESSQLKNKAFVHKGPTFGEKITFRRNNNRLASSKQRTPPWLGKKIQLKKYTLQVNRSTDGEKYVNNDYMKSPQRKKPMIVVGDKNENMSNTVILPTNGKGSLSTKICNISKRALKMIN